MPFTKSSPPVYYEVTGQGPPIIWSHGLLMDHEMFDSQVEAFSQHYTCITWDERAHGKTATLACPEFTYYDSAADLMRILDELKIERAVLAGMSQGGYLSLRAALKYPQRVKALILIDTQALREEEKAIEGHRQILEPFFNTGSLSDDVCQLVAGAIMDPEWKGTPHWIEKWKQHTGPNLKAAFHCLSHRDDIQPLIHKIVVPCLIIHGSADKAITLDRAEKMNDALPHSKMVVIEGHTHAPNMTASDEVNKDIQSFLAHII